MSKKFNPQSPEGQDLLKLFYLSSNMSNHLEKVLEFANKAASLYVISKETSNSMNMVSLLGSYAKKIETSMR